MNRLSQLLIGGMQRFRDHPQLIMTVLLLIVVPVAFIVSGQQFLSASRENQETLEKERIGMMHDLFASIMKTASFDQSRMQKELEYLAAYNPDITKFRIAREEGTEIRIVASLDIEKLNTLAENPNTYRIGNTNPNETIINPFAQNGVRYWQSFRLVRMAGFPDHYIFIETSLEGIDARFAERILSAYYWLIVLITIVLFLVIRHVRIVDYAYLYRETKRANEMKDLFTNMVAHELRAPLTAMRGYASMIRETSNLDATTRKQAQYIEDAAERLVVVVSDLLDVARIQSGKMTIERSDTNVSKIILDVIDSERSVAAAKGISVGAEGVHADVIAHIDGKRLFQALTNLVSNAIKYTHQGTIQVSLEDLRDRIELRVKDTGMGITSEDQKKMFAPFFRVENKEVNAITGTGLGMWITKQLIELMGGSIGIESIRGVGTHVVVTLPKRS